MDIYAYIAGILLLGVCFVLFISYIISSAFELEWRAFRRSIFLFLALLIISAAYIMAPSVVHIWGSTAMAVIGLVCLAVILFPAKWKGIVGDRENLERVDERDIIFSRWRYLPGTEQYDNYYSAHPELQSMDADIRRRPGLFSPGGLFYDPLQASSGKGAFGMLSRLSSMVDGPIAQKKRAVDDAAMKTLLKEMALLMGAHSAGISGLNPSHVYTHVGRGPDPWGKTIELNHTTAISFTLEMDYRAVRSAPRMMSVVETANRYVQGAIISIIIADTIRSWGYSARAHIEGSNYQAILPPLAEEAGLGEIGRIGILITPGLGPRVRLGLVTTDLALTPDVQAAFGAVEFCIKCKKCADACPSGAIPKGDKQMWRGVPMWRMNPEACYRTWRIFGSDCAMCMSVCPYSKPDTFIHNAVRSVIRRSGIAQRAALWADDFFYGTAAQYLSSIKSSGNLDRQSGQTLPVSDKNTGN